MPLHLIKLCVGIDDPSALAERIETQRAAALAAGQPAEIFHTTRVMPRQADDILPDGCLYWVIRARVQARQRILRFDPVTGPDGIERCRIVLEPVLQLTRPQPRRAFQGWRYLKAEDAPADLHGEGGDELPPHLARELADLGLL